MGTLSWWVTLVFARWGWIRTPALWLHPCSSLSGTAMLCTHGSWRTWAPTVQAGATMWLITPQLTLIAHGRTSPRVNWGRTPSGAAWSSTEEEDLWLILGQIHQIQASKYHTLRKLGQDSFSSMLLYLFFCLVLIERPLAAEMTICASYHVFFSLEPFSIFMTTPGLTCTPRRSSWSSQCTTPMSTSSASSPSCWRQQPSVSRQCSVTCVRAAWTLFLD